MEAFYTKLDLGVSGELNVEQELRSDNPKKTVNICPSRHLGLKSSRM
ncbi:hypothetical protein M595_0504 [Lyngbya aestuarii BL J]|uniref:Uncharacterized protein n=1 Tax=Lyngbya aestuarii BL J TaxID=1348334 RepID=U7QSM5_9CYAN|nr:hypothetical protein M595_0504 [Lyngbya aestuarii BL J]